MSADDARLRELGFTDHREGYWYYTTRVGDMTSWNVTISKESGAVDVEVLDEHFLQPYPFQALAVEGVPFAVAVAERVEKRSEEHTSELQSRENLVCRLLLEKKK